LTRLPDEIGGVCSIAETKESERPLPLPSMDFDPFRALFSIVAGNKQRRKLAIR
jgi:hypothetical protein